MNNFGSRSGDALVEPLTARELEILSLIAADFMNREIADRLVLALSTVKWYARQIYGKLGVRDRQAAVARARELGFLVDEKPDPRFQHNLPNPSTPFLGRQAELAAIAQHLLDPDCWLLTLTGPGGSGKTRLAIQAAHQLVAGGAASFPDGIWYVSLAPLEGVAGLLPAVAKGLGFSFRQGETEPRQQILDYLCKKNLLLVLDNYEHLLDEEGLELPLEIRANAPGVKQLVTSRFRLNVQGEQVFPVAGLDTPDIKTVIQWQQPVEGLSQFTGLQLFTQAAARVQPDFLLTSENVIPVTRILQLVSGMPLAIELAASWVSALGPEDILAEITHNFDVLETELHDVPVRQRSIRAVFNTSWALLSPEEKKVMGQLAVFRGCFDWATVREVTSATMPQLRVLVEKSWLQRAADNRYQIHELMRQYAQEKLQADAQAWLGIRNQHSVYFCGLLKTWEEAWVREGQLEALAAVEREIENIEAAWRWAVRKGHWQLIDQGLESLCRYYDWRGRHIDGDAVCQEIDGGIGRTMAGLEVVPPDLLLTRALAVAWQGHFYLYRDDVETVFLRGLSILDRPELAGKNTRRTQAFLLLKKGEQEYLSDREKAGVTFSKSLALYQEEKDESGKAAVLLASGVAAWQLGLYGEAETLTGKSMTIYRRLGNRRGAGKAMVLLGLIVKHLGRLEEAERLQLESLALMDEIDARADYSNMLNSLSHTLTSCGKFSAGLERAMECMAAFESLGITNNLACLFGAARALMHMGQYPRASVHAKIFLNWAQDIGDFQSEGFGFHILADLALAEKHYEDGLVQIEKGIQVFRRIKQNIIGVLLATRSYLQRALGQPELAAASLIEALQISLDMQAFMPVLSAIPIAALLLAGRGDLERAIELYSLACQYPYVDNSRWFYDVVGQELAALAAPLNPDRVAGAQARGASLDLGETAEQLLLDLAEGV